MTTTTNNKPAATLRAGRLKATIWANAGDKGTFYSVKFTRTWQDAAGNYHDGDSFSGVELFLVAHLATKAYEELARLRSADNAGEDEAEQ